MEANFWQCCFRLVFTLDPYQFRQQLVDYLRTLPGEFAEKIEAKFGSFAVYCDTMSLPANGSPAHLLLRPIEVISDCDLEPRRVFEPPRIICEECWGAKITICHTGQNHFEATAPLEVGESAAPPVPKAINQFPRTTMENTFKQTFKTRFDPHGDHLILLEMNRDFTRSNILVKNHRERPPANGRLESWFNILWIVFPASAIDLLELPAIWVCLKIVYP